MYIANELKNMVLKPDIEDIRDSYIDNLQIIVSKFFADKKMFNMDNFSVQVYDEYMMGTNCHDEVFSTVYLIINQPFNYKIDNKKKRSKSDKIQIPDLYIKLSDIKEGLFQSILKHYDSSNIVWQDKYGICQKALVSDGNGNNVSYYFRLIPCLTYYNKNNVQGVMYYSNGDIEIEYPTIALNNYLKKNTQTNDLYRQTVLIFKNILLKEKDIEQLPSEIIETMLYNVPNELFVSDNKSSILNIINFIRNNPLRDFKTIDEEDYAFSSLYRSMSIIYCKHILKIIEKYITRA